MSQDFFKEVKKMIGSFTKDFHQVVYDDASRIEKKLDHADAYFSTNKLETSVGATIL